MTTVATHQHAQQVVVMQPDRLSARDKRGVAIVTPQGAAAIQQQQAVNITPNQISAETQQNLVFATPQAAAAIQQEEAVNIAPNQISAEAQRNVVFSTPQAAAAIQQQQTVSIAPNQISAEAQRNVVFSTSDGVVVLLEDEKIEVKELTTPIIINGLYNRSNHCIHLSREYVGGAKLTRYVNFPGMVVFSLITVFVSVFSPTYFIFAFVMAGFDLAWLLLFVQHLYVTVRTMPHMLRLPRVPNHVMRTTSGFFEISLEKYQAVFGVQAESTKGIIVAAKGTIKLHILTYTAVQHLKQVMIYSTSALIGFFLLMVYSLVYGITGSN